MTDVDPWLKVQWGSLTDHAREIQVALSLLHLLILTCYPISCHGAVVKTYDPIKKDAKWDLCQSLEVTNDVTSAIVVTQINPWGKTRDPDPILATVSLKSKSTSCIRKAFIACAMLRCSAAWSPEMIWCEDQGHAVWLDCPTWSYILSLKPTTCYQQSCAATAICHSSASERKSKTSCGVVFGSCCENAAASLGGTLCDVANFPWRHWLIEQPPSTKVHHLLTCATPRSLGPNVAGQNGKHPSVASLPRRTNLKESQKHEIPVQTFWDPRLYLLPKVGTVSGSPANPASCSSKYRVRPPGLITLSIRYSREMDLAMISLSDGSFWCLAPRHGASSASSSQSKGWPLPFWPFHEGHEGLTKMHLLEPLPPEKKKRKRRPANSTRLL